MGKIIAIVGMPGSGKSEASAVLEKAGYKRIRFGDITEEELEKKGLEINEKNERKVREQLREEHGMAAFAKLNIPKIEAANGDVVLDGLYSLEEYLLLKERYPEMVVVAVYASPATRQKRLANRDIRPLEPKQVKERDLAQLQKLHTGGPIALADVTIINEGTLEQLKKEVKKVTR